MPTLFDIPLTRIDGAKGSLADYAGKVLLIVNVASRCGMTPQYDGLEALQRRYRDAGFTVLGFPSNDFHGQEPGTEAEIAAFCRSTYGVDFPMVAKIAVTGPDKHPLYRALTDAEPTAVYREDSSLLPYVPDPDPGEVHWNFEKFLVDRSGAVVGRFAPDTEPQDPTIVGAIEAALAA
jgi:glutathione peroxidase